MQIILASGSPRRKELLHYIFDSYDVITSKVEEIVPENTKACDIPEYLAQLKCTAVAKDYPNALVIGADTVVVCENVLFGKPKNEADAKNMLNRLSGKKHSVITGCCIAKGGKICSFSQTTSVEFYPLTDLQIEQYIKTGEPMDKAGAYGIQGYGSLLIKGISGDYFNVVGLPVARLKRELDKI